MINLRLLSGSLCLLGCLALGADRANASSVTIFTLERTTNANQVVYELRDDGSIHPYWRMLAQDGHTEELTALERAEAYGVQIVGRSAGQVEFSVKALPSYPITVLTTPPAGQPYGTIRLMGEDRAIKRIYLHVSGGLFPKVSSIDIEAQNGDSGPMLYFDLAKSGSGLSEKQVTCVPEWMPGC
jgi:hypothetical protein